MESPRSADPAPDAGVGESSFLLRPTWASQMTDVQERKLIFGVVAGSLFTSSFLCTFVIPLLPEFRYKQALSLFETSSVFASFALGELAGVPISVLLAGQIKCWVLMAIALVFLLLYSITFMSSESEFGIIFTARFLGGIASSVLRVAGFALVDDMYLPSERSQRTVILYFCIAFGLTMGPLLGGSLASDDAFYSALLGAVGCAGLVGVIMFFMRTNSVELPKAEPLVPHLRHPPTLLSLCTIALVGSIVAFTEVILPLHLSVDFQTTPAAVGGLFMILSISYIFMANLTAILSERINRNLMVASGLVGTALASVTLTAPPSLAVEVVPVLILGAASSVVCGGALLRLVDSMHGGDIQPGALSQVTGVARGVGAAIGPIFFAILSETFGFGNDNASYVFGVIAIVAAVALALKVREEPTSEDDAHTVPAVADLQLQFTM